MNYASRGTLYQMLQLISLYIFNVKYILAPLVVMAMRGRRGGAGGSLTEVCKPTSEGLNAVGKDNQRGRTLDGKTTGFGSESH